MKQTSPRPVKEHRAGVEGVDLEVGRLRQLVGLAGDLVLLGKRNRRAQE